MIQKQPCSSQNGKCGSSDFLPAGHNPSENKGKTPELTEQKKQSVPVHRPVCPVETAQNSGQREIALDVPKLRLSCIASRQDLCHQRIVVQIVVIRKDSAEKKRRCQSKHTEKQQPCRPALPGALFIPLSLFVPLFRHSFSFAALLSQLFFHDFSYQVSQCVR